MTSDLFKLEKKMQDMFKIVQTIERGLKQLTIVPSGWEYNNQLHWPKLGAEKLIRTANSLPEANWFTMACKLKRNHLFNYEIAEEELNRMLENDDTEQEDILEVQTKKRPSVKLPKSISSEHNFNELANKCMLTASLEDSRVKSSKTELDTEVLLPQKTIQQIIPDGLRTEKSSLDAELMEKFESLIINQDIIMNNQKLILEREGHLSYLENIMQLLAKLQTSIDVMASHSINNNCTCNTATQNNNNIDDIFFEPIDSLAVLEKLEAKLANKKEMEDLIQKFSYVCGRKGCGNGTNNCYILVDKIFSRKFMTLCSWAGGAKDPGKEKIPFKFFKNVIGLFFRVVRLSDEDFTLKNCEEFFKAVIRNSTKRNESSMTRTSRSKRRPKSLSYKVMRELFSWLYFCGELIYE